MASKTNTNLRIGFGLSILLLVVSSVVSFVCIQNLLKSSQWVKHTNEIAQTLESVLSSLKDAETGQRGYVISGDEEYLEPYKGAYGLAQTNLRKVIEMTADNPLQQSNAERLQVVMNKRGDRLQHIIDLKRQGKAIDMADMKAGKLYMDSVRHIIKQMVSEEQKLLATRTATEEKFSFYTPIVIVLAALLAIIISLVFYMRVIKDVAARVAMQNLMVKKDIETAERIDLIQSIADKISQGDYDIRVDDSQKDALGSLSNSLNRMAESLDFSFGKLKDNEWLQSGLAQLNEKMVGEKNLQILTTQIIDFLTSYTGSHVGAFYLLQQETLVLSSSYAVLESVNKEIGLGRGIVGQTMLSGKEIYLNNIEPGYVSVSHATGNIVPRALIALPVFDEGENIGVLELASVVEYTERELVFLREVARNIGTAIRSAQNHKKLQELLEETQAQSEELQAQHSELESMNTELEAHTQKLQTSEEELRVQQEELQQTNSELESRNRIINERNSEIQSKAEALELSTRYKSEFMANMSHELRTPLNSILLLSRYLSENNEHNLTEDQKESASVIFNSGSGLLTLIDELLDLSKIEAGKMELDYAEVEVEALLSSTKDIFIPVAKSRNVDFIVKNELTNLSHIESDKMKLDQILKNLISNALKFTEEGHVLLKVSSTDNEYVQFSVEDTGVGIAADKLDLIFEAFTQEDGSTKRKYGGTGLGLSISRQLARLLGGEISVSSVHGKGSVFLLIIPIRQPKEDAIPQASHAIQQPTPITETSKKRHIALKVPQEVEDDRNSLMEHDKIILIVEDDTVFAKSLLQYARKQNYKGIVAVRGDQGLEFALHYRPLAILLDIHLPVKDGWEVMEELKSDIRTRHVPVHIMSSMEVKKESKMHGALDFFNKPLGVDHMDKMFKKIETVLSKNPKKVLIIEENNKHAKALANYLKSYNVQSSVEQNITGSLAALKDSEVDCVILDMGIPDKTGYEALETIKQNPGMEDMPIIVFTGKNLSHAEESRIRQYADSIVIKTAHSYQRILDEVGLFLHVIEEQNSNTDKGLKSTTKTNDTLNGKTILVADDDVRNIFSLTKALEKYNVHVITATDGSEALQQLEQHPNTDIVLMDMMMPQMDGYESTSKIRQHPRFKNIPVIAVTAKAMLGDREKCIAAGASDYISKPVDTDQLISLLRVWLYDK